MHCILHSLSMLRLCDIRTTGHSKAKPSGPDAGLCKPGSLLFNCFISGDSYIFSLASGQVWVITAKESSSTLSSSQDLPSNRKISSVFVLQTQTTFGFFHTL